MAKFQQLYDLTGKVKIMKFLIIYYYIKMQNFGSSINFDFSINLE